MGLQAGGRASVGWGAQEADGCPFSIRHGREAILMLLPGQLAAADSASWWLGQASLPSHPFSVSRRQKPAPAPWALRRDLLGHMDPGIWRRNSAACYGCCLRQVPGTEDGVCGWWNFKGPSGLSLSNWPDRTGCTSQPCQSNELCPALPRGLET